MLNVLRIGSKNFPLILSLGLLLGSLGQASAQEFELKKDISYREKSADAKLDDYALERCKLDLYVPKGKKNFATIVWFHGGALKAGDKTTEIAVKAAERFAKEGIGFASVNYRLYPKVKFPIYIQDAAAAVAFVQKHIAEHGGNPHKVFVSGHSAGGYLTAMVGVDPQYLAEFDLKPNDLAGFMPVSGQMITHSTVREERGIPRTRPVIDEAAPSWHVSAQAPPFICMAGGEDLALRAAENIFFVAAMKGAGNRVSTYLEYPGRTHSTIASELGNDDDAVAQDMLRFMRQFSP